MAPYYYQPAPVPFNPNALAFAGLFTGILMAFDSNKKTQALGVAIAATSFGHFINS